jgi:hypothetical protein
MADTDDIEEGTPIQESPDSAPPYPDGPVGTLMQQRDTLRGQAASNRSYGEQLLQSAKAAEQQADQLQAAIDAIST